MNKTDVLIAGGGISGISAAIELAETGLDVILIEKLSYLGGRVVRMNQYFPKLCPPTCGLEINFRRIRNLPNLSVHTDAVINKIEGQEGDFTVTLQKSPEYVNNKCTACGECSKVCPHEGPDAFNYGLKSRKAIALPHELSFPFRYSIDPDHCTFENCKKCIDVCSYGAIYLEATPSEIELEVNSIIFATGWKPYEPSSLPEYSFDTSDRIITNVMMERMAAPNGPTQGKIPATKIAFVQCAGSRDINHQPWCSAVCCSASLKQALHFVEQDMEARAVIFYIDLRVSGRNEDFLKKVEEHPRIELIKGKVAEITTDGDTGSPILKAEDIMGGKIIEETFDLVILATGISPHSPGLSLQSSGLAIEDFQYSNTVNYIQYSNEVNHNYPEKYSEPDNLSDLNMDGIIKTGCARKPMDVSSCVKDAGWAALRALQVTMKKQH